MDNMYAENETMFLSWLSSNVSPAQLSELYLAFSEIEQQAKKSKLIRRSLYENLSVSAVKKIRADIERSRIFKFTHKRQWSRILSALDYLQKFAAHNQVENLAEKVSSSIAGQGEATDSYMNPEMLNTTLPEQKETEEVRSVHADETLLSEGVKTAETEGTVHFDALESMAFTKPISLSYFGDTREESSWKGLYVDACVMLYEDYPEIITRLREDSLSSVGKTWLVDAAHMDTLAVPKKLVEDFYVETNRSATDLVKNLKWLLDECSVDYENVVISYSRHTEPAPAPKPVVEPLQRLPRSSYSDENGVKNAYYCWLIDSQHKAESTSRVYASAIGNAEQIAKESGLANNKLYTENPDEAKATASALFSDPFFNQKNTSRHNQLRAAIALLLEYYASSADVSQIKGYQSLPEETNSPSVLEATRPSDEETIASFLVDDEFAPLREALASQKINTVAELKSLKLWPFMNRYNIYSIGMRQTVFSKVNAMLYPVTELDETQAYILRIGDKRHKGGTPAESFQEYCEDMLRRYPLQMRLLIGMRTPSGKVPISKNEQGGQSLSLSNLQAYIDTDLSVDDVLSFTEWVCGRCGEKSTGITILKPQNISIPHSTTASPETGLRIERKVVSISEPMQAMQQSQLQRIRAYAKKLEELALAADMQGVSYDDARDAMRVTMVATKQAAAAAEHIVDIKGRLFHEEAFIDWEDGANQLEGIIDKLMQKNSGYIAAAQLYEYAKVEMNMFLTDNDLNDERSVYDIATHLFEKKGYHDKHYSFYGKMHISRKDHPVTSNIDIIRNFAADQGGIFSFDSLVEYLHSIGVASGNLRMQMRIPDEPIFFYYENGILIYADNMHIDDAWISAVKNELAILLTDVGGHIVLRAVPDIWLEQLPSLPAGKHWTPLLLQSVLRCYSKDLGAKTIQALSGQSQLATLKIVDTGYFGDSRTILGVTKQTFIVNDTGLDVNIDIKPAGALCLVLYTNIFTFSDVTEYELSVNKFQNSIAFDSNGDYSISTENHNGKFDWRISSVELAEIDKAVYSSARRWATQLPMNNVGVCFSYWTENSTESMQLGKGSTYDIKAGNGYFNWLYLDSSEFETEYLTVEEAEKLFRGASARSRGCSPVFLDTKPLCTTKYAKRNDNTVGQYLYPKDL